MHFVYVLYSEKFGKIYIGSTADIGKRLIFHNHPRNKGWTKRYQPWKIIYTEKLDSKSLVLKREKQLTSAKGRRFIWQEIIKE